MPPQLGDLAGQNFLGENLALPSLEAGPPEGGLPPVNNRAGTPPEVEKKGLISAKGKEGFMRTLNPGRK